MQVLELQRQFVGMQWERPEEPPFIETDVVFKASIAIL